MRKKKLISFAIILAIMSTVFAVAAQAADIAGVRAGEYYFLRNVGSGLYMDVTNGTDANYTNVITHGYNGGTNQQFRVLKPGDKYKFAARCSSSGRVLDVTDSNVDIYSDSNASYQQFTLVRLSDGTYNIKYGSSYMIANSSTNNVGISTSSNGNYSKWSFEKASKGDADIYSFNLSGYNSTLADSTFKSSVNGMGYTGYVLTNTSASNAETNMIGDDIWVHNGKGAAGSMAFYNGSGTSTGTIIISDINSMGANSLASMRVFISTAANVANDINGNPTTAANNLIQAVYSKGAHFAIGYRDVATYATASSWIQSFFTRVDDGVTVKTAVEYADFWNNTGDKYAVGDTYQTLT